MSETETETEHTLALYLTYDGVIVSRPAYVTAETQRTVKTFRENKSFRANGYTLHIDGKEWSAINSGVLDGKTSKIKTIHVSPANLVRVTWLVDEEGVFEVSLPRVCTHPILKNWKNQKEATKTA